MRRSTILLAALGAACAPSPGESSAAPAAAALSSEPCAVPVPEGHGEWRQMRGDGFRFCVPASWRPATRRAKPDGLVREFRFLGGEVEWYTGTRASRQEIVAMPVDALPQEQQFTETIGGRTAELWNNRFRQEHYTGARWTRPELTFTGKASGPSDAFLQLAVYRTVRFTGE